MSYRQKYKNDQSVQIFDTLLKGIWFVISYPFKLIFGIKAKSPKFNKAVNLQKWLEIESMLKSGDEIHAAQAVIQADKFFENIIKIDGAYGKTFADKLRSWKSHFSRETHQAIWDAHKVRNQITHDADHKPTVSECKIAAAKFRKGLNALGAI